MIAEECNQTTNSIISSIEDSNNEVVTGTEDHQKCEVLNGRRANGMGRAAAEEASRLRPSRRKKYGSADRENKSNQSISSSSVIVLNRNDLNGMTYQQLRTYARSIGTPAKGKKKQLIDSILLNQNIKSSIDEEKTESEISACATDQNGNFSTPYRSTERRQNVGAEKCLDKELQSVKNDAHYQQINDISNEECAETTVNEKNESQLATDNVENLAAGSNRRSSLNGDTSQLSEEFYSARENPSDSSTDSIIMTETNISSFQTNTQADEMKQEAQGSMVVSHDTTIEDLGAEEVSAFNISYSMDFDGVSLTENKLHGASELSNFLVEQEEIAMEEKDEKKICDEVEATSKTSETNYVCENDLTVDFVEDDVAMVQNICDGDVIELMNNIRTGFDNLHESIIIGQPESEITVGAVMENQSNEELSDCKRKFEGLTPQHEDISSVREVDIDQFPQKRAKISSNIPEESKENIDDSVRQKMKGLPTPVGVKTMFPNEIDYLNTAEKKILTQQIKWV